MAYVPGYDYDFFVSYAKVDNDPVPSAKSGWVDTLISILISGNGLAGKLGRREAFNHWIDKQNLRGNDEVDRIPEQVGRSALFVAVLSPAYAASKFCQLELETFLKSTGGAPSAYSLSTKNSSSSAGTRYRKRSTPSQVQVLGPRQEQQAACSRLAATDLQQS